MTASILNLMLYPNWAQSRSFIIVKCKPIFQLHTFDQLHTFKVTCSLMKQKDFLMKMTQDVGILCQAVAQHRIHLVGEVVSRWLAYIFETISCLFISKMCQSGLNIPRTLWRVEVRGSSSYCETSNRNSCDKTSALLKWAIGLQNLPVCIGCHRPFMYSPFPYVRFTLEFTASCGHAGKQPLSRQMLEIVITALRGDSCSFLNTCERWEQIQLTCGRKVNLRGSSHWQMLLRS